MEKKNRNIFSGWAFVLLAAFTITSLLSCSDVDFMDNSGVEGGYGEVGETGIPLSFDWSVSNDLELTVKSEVTTRVCIYEDKECTRLMCSTLVMAGEAEIIPLTVMKAKNELYMAFLNKDGEREVRTIDLTNGIFATRSVCLVYEENLGDDAAEILTVNGSTLLFSPDDTEFGTLLFEDMYPETGDYDMNDFVLGYKKEYACDDDVEVLRVLLQVRAIGGTKPFAPAVEIEGVNIADIESMSWTTTDDKLYVENAAENEENGTPVFRLKGVDQLKSADGYFNVTNPVVPKDKLPYVTITLTRTLDGKGKGKGKLNVKDKDLNFFIYNTNTLVEIHEKNRKVTRYARNMDYDEIRKYKNFHRGGQVWAFRVDGYLPHTYEGVRITSAFPGIETWMISSGNKNRDWYESYYPAFVISYDKTATGGTQQQYVNVKQATVEVGAAGGRVEVPVEANCEYDIYAGENGWIYDFIKEDGKLVVFVRSNYNNVEKVGTVTLVPQGSMAAKATFEVKQATEAYAGTLIDGNANFRNNAESLIKANGGVIDDLKHIVFRANDSKYADMATLPTNVKNIGKKNFEKVFMEWNAATNTISVTTPGAVIRTGGDCSDMMKNCYGLETVDFTGIDLSNATRTERMFFQCKQLQYVDMSMCNTPNLTNMNCMFQLCESLKGVNLTGLNTSNVTGMRCLFDRCYKLESADLSSLNMGNVTNMYRMFWNCQSLQEVKFNGSKTNLSDADDSFKEVFINCYKLKRVDFSNFDFANVTKLYSTFCNCTSLEEVVFGAHNTSNIQMLYRTFEGAGSGDFKCVNADFSSVTSVENMCKGFQAESIDLSGWTLPNVDKFQSLFDGATAKTINISGWSAANATSVHRMFAVCKSVESIDLGSNFHIPASLNTDYWFYCTSQTSQHTVLKCSSATYGIILSKRNAQGKYTDNSGTFFNKYVEFDVYQ